MYVIYDNSCTKIFYVKSTIVIETFRHKAIAYPLILDDADQLGTNSVPGTIWKILIYYFPTTNETKWEQLGFIFEIFSCSLNATHWKGLENKLEIISLFIAIISSISTITRNSNHFLFFFFFFLRSTNFTLSVGKSGYLFHPSRNVSGFLLGQNREGTVEAKCAVDRLFRNVFPPEEGRGAGKRPNTLSFCFLGRGGILSRPKKARRFCSTTIFEQFSNRGGRSECGVATSAIKIYIYIFISLLIVSTIFESRHNRRRRISCRPSGRFKGEERKWLK